VKLLFYVVGKCKMKHIKQITTHSGCHPEPVEGRFVIRVEYGAINRILLQKTSQSALRQAQDDSLSV
jgi:hypothetical protein